MPENYHLFGFGTKKRRDFKRYIGEPWSEPFVRSKIGKIWRNGIVLRDKHFFKIICEYHHLPVPKTFGLLKSGQLYGGKDNTLALIERHGPERLVLKPILGQNGVGIQFINPSDLESVLASQFLQNDIYLIEEAVRQHPDLEKVNPFSVNSIRLITFLSPDGSVDILTGMLKTSSSKAPIDNFSLGGIAIGIDLDTGTLKTVGYTKFYCPDGVIDNRKSTDPAEVAQILREIQTIQKRFPGRMFECHPLTRLRFEGFQLPFWGEVVQVAIRAQQVFGHGKANAIDIAISTDGPVILEANEGWGTTGIQTVNGGLLTERNKKLFSRYGIEFY